MRVRTERAVLIAVGSTLAAFLVFPLLALVMTTTRQQFIAGLTNPMVWPALRLSALTTASSLVIVIVLGTPLAWTLSRSASRVAHTLETLVEMPIVVPPAVSGVALLLAFGRHGLLSRVVQGPNVVFTTTAVIMAEIFVSAPFFVQAAISAFRRVDANLLIVARTFGASPLRVFVRIALPLATPGLVAGASMSWARSLGEFGATLMFAGNLQGVTQTLPLAIYTALESDLRVAQALSVILVIVAFIVLVVARASLRRSKHSQENSA